MTRVPAEPSAAAKAKRSGPFRPVFRGIVNVFAVLGVLALGITATGLAIDVSNFDRTSGGYEPPFEGWTGTPIDWQAGSVTAEGFRQTGLVVDTLLNCTTGMISVESFGIEVNFRILSERALVVHKPVEACEAEGFTPDFAPTPGA